MATVEFECPECGQICGFHDRYVGRRARCTKCNTQFLIPPAGQPAKALKPIYREDGPWSGFWTALLRQSPKALAHPTSLGTELMMALTSVVRYFIGHPFFIVYVPFFFAMLPIPVGIFVLTVTVGFQCRYLFDIIQSTADQNDPLPPPFGENLADRFFASLISIYVTAILLGISLAPACLIWWGLRKASIQAVWPVAAAGAIGLFFLPLMLTIYAYSRDILMALRFDSILRAARKAFWPHIMLYVQMLAMAALLWSSSLFRLNAPTATIGRDVAFHVLATGIGIFAARTAGLFYRHYGCYLP